MTMKDLRARAAEAGVNSDVLEDARDADEPKPLIVDLILATYGASP
jgi:hypothetical protein